MISKTLHRFKTLPLTARAMVYLFWIYEFSQIIVNLFLNLFVFMETNSLMGLVIYNLTFFLAIFLGFVVWGFFMSRRQISLKNNYFRSFVVYVVSFLTLILFHPFREAGVPALFLLLLFAGLNGIGLGMFWVGVHAYEMVTTNSGNRDFYSSMVSAGGQVLGILAPLLATLSFFLSEKILHIETFQILFLALPFVYLFALPFVFRLPDFTPPKITYLELKRLFTSKDLGPVRNYIFSTSLPWGIRVVMMPTIILFSLKTVINVGLFQTLAGILSVLVIIFLSHERHEGNRMKILGFATLLLLVDLGILSFWQQTPYAYVLYTLLLVMAQPVHRVSQHVLDLHSMELLRDENKDFYAGMLYRDCIITAGRFASIIAVGILVFLLEETLAIQICIGLSALSYFWNYLTAKRMLRLN